jgi:hypothetical protein
LWMRDRAAPGNDLQATWCAPTNTVTTTTRMSSLQLDIYGAMFLMRLPTSNKAIYFLFVLIFKK